MRTGGSRALRAFRAERDRTKDRVIAGMLAGAFGVAERNNVFAELPGKLFDDHAHTLALLSAGGAMVFKGSARKVLDHVANAMVPVSAYKLGAKGFDPESDGFLEGIDDDIAGDDD